MVEILDYLNKWLDVERKSWPKYIDYINKYKKSYEFLNKIPSSDEFIHKILELLGSNPQVVKFTDKDIEGIFSEMSEKSWDHQRSAKDRISSGINDYIDLLRDRLRISESEAAAVQTYISDLTEPILHLIRLPFSYYSQSAEDYKIFNGNKYIKLLRFLDQIRENNIEELKKYENYKEAELELNPALYRNPYKFFGLSTLLFELYGIVNLDKDSVYIYNSRIVLAELGYKFKKPKNFQDIFDIFEKYDKFVAEKYTNFIIDKNPDLINALPQSLNDEQKRFLLRHIEVDQFFSSYKEYTKVNKHGIEQPVDTPNETTKSEQPNYEKVPRNMILHGPVGTGKTFYAGILASGIIDGKIKSMEDIEKLFKGKSTLLKGYNEKLLEMKELTMVTFHQSYGYEEFIAGISASTKDGKIVYDVQEGIFLKLCKEAKEQLGKRYVILIDEINRGDISRIFGELITLIEEDKRYFNNEKPGLSLTIPNLNNNDLNSNEANYKFSVPYNVFIIGTMNDSDRSIALLDTALRRRFTFFNVPPNGEILKNWISEESGIRDLVLKSFQGMNKRIAEVKGEDLQIGHAFFKSLKDLSDPIESKKELLRIFKYKVLPMLKETFYGQDDTLSKKILKGNFLEKDQNGSSYRLNEDKLDIENVDSFMDEFKKLGD